MPPQGWGVGGDGVPPSAGQGRGGAGCAAGAPVLGQSPAEQPVPPKRPILLV